MATKEFSTELSALAAKMDDWRRGREKRTRIPEGLWDEAIQVAKQAGLWATAKATRIHYPDLKERVAKVQARRADGRPARARGADGQGGRGRANGTGLVGPAAFVELPRAAMSPATKTVVEFEGKGGDRMRIEVSGGVDLAELARAFLVRDSR